MKIFGISQPFPNVAFERIPENEVKFLAVGIT